MTAAAIQNNNQRVCVVLALGMATLVPSQQWNDFEQVMSQRIEAIASFAPVIRTNDNTPRTSSLVTAQEKIANLRSGGLPVSAMAEAMRVERKSIYSWLSGGDMRSANIQRAAQLHALLTGVAGVDVRSLYRFWNTPVDGTKTLRELMVAENIDTAETASTLERLRPAALRAMETERKMARKGTSNPVLDEIPEAGANG